MHDTSIFYVQMPVA